MTYAELTTKMTNAEFELWLGLAYARATECTHCGVDPRDLMKYSLNEIKCPVCHQMYHKVVGLPER